MQKFSTIRRIAPVVAILALAVMMTASCTSSNKYGCPNKLQTSLK